MSEILKCTSSAHSNVTRSVTSLLLLTLYVFVLTYMQLGIVYFLKDYTGGPLLYATGLYYCMKQLVLHPFTPLYIRVSTFSYMSYSVGCLHVLSLWYRALYEHFSCMHFHSLTDRI